MIALRDIDVDYDFRTDASDRDPDTHSKTLRAYHRALWTKPLPSGEVLELAASRAKPYLTYQRSNGDAWVLTSDTMLNSHRGKLGYLRPVLSDAEWAEYLFVGHTIGGRMVFPGLRVSGQQTFNQKRGTHPRIRDRFDLSLECIRRHYAGEPSPLDSSIALSRGFFELFVDFPGYVSFFLLDDYVNDDGEVALFAHHDGFDTDPLPKTPGEYREYIVNQVAAAKRRNERIRALVTSVAAGAST